MPARPPRHRPVALIGFVALAVLLRLAVYAVPAQWHGGLAEAMCQFDCGWYERIALEGYGADSEWGSYGSLPHWAFFPLWPLLLRAAAGLSGLPVRLAGILLASALLAGFMLAGAAYLQRTRANAAPFLFVALVAVFPNSFFFSAVYTEALFALLCTLCLLALAGDRLWTAAAIAALASAARPTGVLLAPMIAAHALWAGERSGSLLRKALPAMLAPLGLLTFMAVQFVAVGDAMAFSHVQALWGRAWLGPVTYLSEGLAAWDWAALGGWMGRPSRSYAAAWGVLGLAAAAWLLWRRRFGESWLLAACVLLPAATGLDSMPRYVACNPVFLFAAHDAVARFGRSGRGVALVTLAVLGFVPLLAWMRAAGGVF